MKKSDKQFDFTPIGKTIKQARISKGMTREQVCNVIDIDPRYLAHLENDGRCPSMELFFRLVTYFDISVDQFFFKRKMDDISADQQALEYTLRKLDKDLIPVVQSTVNSLMQYTNKKAKKQ